MAPPFHMAEVTSDNGDGTVTYWFRHQFPVITPETSGTDPDTAGWTADRWNDLGVRIVEPPEHPDWYGIEV